MNEEYAMHMFIEIYQTSRDKGTVPHVQRFVIFMIQYHSQRTSEIMKKAGCTDNEIITTSITTRTNGSTSQQFDHYLNYNTIDRTTATWRRTKKRLTTTSTRCG
eukprot:6290102-Amphidinium_carterae.1